MVGSPLGSESTRISSRARSGSAVTRFRPSAAVGAGPHRGELAGGWRPLACGAVYSRGTTPFVALSGDGADRRSAVPYLLRRLLGWQYAVSSPWQATVPA